MQCVRRIFTGIWQYAIGTIGAHARTQPPLYTVAVLNLHLSGSPVRALAHAFWSHHGTVAPEIFSTVTHVRALWLLALPAACDL